MQAGPNTNSRLRLECLSSIQATRDPIPSTIKTKQINGGQSSAGLQPQPGRTSMCPAQCESSSCNLLANGTLVAFSSSPSPLPPSLALTTSWLFLQPIALAHLHGQPQLGLYPATRLSLPRCPTFPGTPAWPAPREPPPQRWRAAAGHTIARASSPPPRAAPRSTKAAFFSHNRLKTRRG